MSIYYIVVFCVVLFCTWAQKYDYKIIDTTSTEKIKHTSSTKMFFVFAVIVLIFVAGFRYHVGADYGAYYRGCENYSNSFFKHLISLNEPGIRLIAKIVTIFKGNGKFIILNKFVLASSPVVMPWLNCIFHVVQDFSGTIDMFVFH